MVSAMRPSRRDSGMVDVTFDGPIATVTIGTGRRRNALNGDAWKDLAHQIIGVSTHASLGVVVLRGVGDTFCAGSDVTEWVGACAEDVEESFAQMEAAFRAIEICPVPVIAQISGRGGWSRVSVGTRVRYSSRGDFRQNRNAYRASRDSTQSGIRGAPCPCCGTGCGR